MLKTYEVAIENGQVLWLDEKPEVTSGRALLTILEENNNSSVNVPPTQSSGDTPKPCRRFPPASLAGTVKILGDIVSPIVDEEDWECLK